MNMKLCACASSANSQHLTLSCEAKVIEKGHVKVKCAAVSGLDF